MYSPEQRERARTLLGKIQMAAKIATQAWENGDVIECHYMLDNIASHSIYVKDLCRGDLMQVEIGKANRARVSKGEEN